MEAFLDELTITVIAGAGGAGAVSWRREAHVPRGGPDGGNGGAGGDVLFVADNRLTTFYGIRSKRVFKAARGEDGKKRLADGHNGEDLRIGVPVGTLVFDDEGNTVADLLEDGQTFLAARGGKGGMGNTFYKSPTNQAPAYAQHGLQGEERTYRLEMKLIADVGLVGFPNAGKSTLISVLTRAHPKVASYPFTTLTPNLGVCYIDYDASFIIADIPGIIEGAHEGAGLGLTFLRHIERTKALAFIIDITEEELVAAFRKLRNELASHSETLALKPALAIFTKKDLVDDDLAEGLIDEFLKDLTDEERACLKGTYSISALALDGTKPLARELFHHVRAVER